MKEGKRTSKKGSKKSWAEKIENGKDPKIVVIEKAMADAPAGSRMLVATPAIVANYINHIQQGHQGSLQQMRKDLAIEYQADVTCPLTSGIFLRIVAEAAYEEYLNGKNVDDITPFWRMMNSGSPILKKLACGGNFVKKLRENEHLD